jgi:nitrate/nitrite transporter NarK
LFLIPTAQALHASTTAVSAAIIVALLVGATAMLPIGRYLDRHGGRVLMTGSSVLATPARHGRRRTGVAA